ncbi:MAG: ABC1 kinase family protein, partial [Planctomycetaceae bacterium]
MSPLRLLRNLGRTREIVLVLLNHGFGDLVERLGLLRYLRWWNRVVLRRGEGPPSVTAPERIRLVLEELGPTFVKFGQMASTRPDLVPAGVIAQLRRLQERVAAFSSAEAVAIVESELGGAVDQLFSRFDRTPLAAGSLGQVHRARLPDGTEVAVKIRRPNAPRDVERDLALMAELAGLIEAHIPEADVFDPQGLVQQFARSIRRELSFQREGRTIDEFRRHFSHDASLVLPRVYWDRTSEGVLTMDYLEGLGVGDIEGLKRAGYQTELLAANGARIFLKMAFELGLFHGDPHPGNLRVLPGGVLGLLDFGMVGRLEPDKRELLVWERPWQGEPRRVPLPFPGGTGIAA